MMHRWQLRSFAALLVAAVITPVGAALAADPEGEAWQRPLPAERVAELAARVDELVDAGLAEHDVRPNDRLGDEEFLRRAYLDIVGRIPSFEEVMRFRNSRSRNKRAELIDQLLQSEGHVSHKFNYWADILRATSNLNRASGQPYIEYIKETIRENKPYDQFVRELLTAEGRLHENGAVGYFIRDDGMALDNTNNTVRIFLGTSIGCAQCHDHPFDQWSQIEFFEMAAYTFGVRTRDGVGSINRAYQQARNDDDTPRNIVNALRNLRDHYNFRVYDTDSQIRLPHDYQYADARPGDTVEPFTIFGDVAEPDPNQTPRDAYARWLTASDNPRFAKVIANRLWQRAFGVGLIEPVDELRHGDEAFNPALMEFLTQLMVDLEFDLREFQRVVYNSQAYQREASASEWQAGDEYHFPGPLLRRMTAEQVWDSFVTLAVGHSLDDRPEAEDRYNGSGVDWRSMDVENMSPEEIRQLAEQIAQEGMGMMMGGGGGDSGAMIRASDLPSPAPQGHFLWRFGQSDRQLIDNSTRDASTTQVLTLLNGPIDRILLRDRSYLYEVVWHASSNADKISAIWLSILNRRPTTAERNLAMREIQHSGDEAFDNLVWALLNTREFMFIQ